MHEQGDGHRPWGPALQQLAGELNQSLQTRRELAELEIGHDRSLLRRFAMVGGAATGVLLIGVSLLLTAAAWELSQVTDLSFATWLTLLGIVLCVPGSLALARGIHTLRTEFCGLRGTLAELREDLAWLREWTHREGEEVEIQGPHEVGSSADSLR